LYFILPLRIILLSLIFNKKERENKMEQDLGLLLDASTTTETVDAGLPVDPTVDQTLPETADMSAGELGGSTSEETTDQSVDVLSPDASMSTGGSNGGVSAGQVGGVEGGVVAGSVGGVTAGEEVVDTPEDTCTELNPEDCICEEPTEGDMCVEEPATTETHTEVKKKDDDSCDQISITSPVLMVALFAAVIYRKFAIFSR
jgi:hypothetical protein